MSVKECRTCGYWRLDLRVRGTDYLSWGLCVFDPGHDHTREDRPACERWEERAKVSAQAVDPEAVGEAMATFAKRAGFRWVVLPRGEGQEGLTDFVPVQRAGEKAPVYDTDYESYMEGVNLGWLNKPIVPEHVAPPAAPVNITALKLREIGQRIVDLCFKEALYLPNRISAEGSQALAKLICEWRGICWAEEDEAEES